MTKSAEQEILTVAGREVAISNPHKVLFPQAGHTKLDLARYYLAVADGALRGAGGRPNVLVRYPNGIGGEFFYQKRAPSSRPAWIEVVALQFPSGRTAEEVVPRDAGGARCGWPTSRASSCTRIRCAPTISIIPTSCASISIRCPASSGRRSARSPRVVRATLDDFGLIGWPKTSGSRGMHVYVRIERQWTFDEVRRAALAFAREVERRAPALATSKWWKEERHGVFLDYNQNAKDRTIASAYSVRPTPDARVSAPLAWDEVDDCEPARLHARHDAGAVRGGRRSARGHRRSGRARSTRCSSCRRGTSARDWATRRGRRTTGSRPANRRASAFGQAARGRPRLPTRPADRDRPRADEGSDALAGLERWQARHPDAAAHLEPADVLVDAMRGRFRTWTRIRVNLQHVPESLRPAQEALDPDDTPDDWSRRQSERVEAPKTFSSS